MLTTLFSMNLENSSQRLHVPLGLSRAGHVGAERGTEAVRRSGAYVWISFTFNFPLCERRYVAVSDGKPSVS